MTDEHEQAPLTNTGPGSDDDADASNPNPEASDVDGAEELACEDAIEELETIVEDLEDGDLPLEVAMERFERGLGLVEACRTKLDQAELKVEELLDDGSTEEGE
jgi:exodeoxyribonuclease VII small subunit